MENKYSSLTPTQLDILRDKGTERPFSGSDQPPSYGTYLCRGCGRALFRGTHQFQSACGWPSFDDEIPEAIRCLPDPDGRRTEIQCAHCHSHLGHVFQQEGFTAKNIRHCVNAIAIEFVADDSVLETEEAIFAAGCFWGVEYLFQKKTGVLKTEVGYIGGIKENPTYQQVCSGNTHHVEAVRVIFDPVKISYENLIKFYFEIHDPTQIGGQGPDLGSQYQSVIFYYDSEQKKTAAEIINVLEKKGYSVTTQLLAVSVFWPAEEYHQHYYDKTGKKPYCHFYKKRF